MNKHAKKSMGSIFDIGLDLSKMGNVGGYGGYSDNHYSEIGGFEKYIASPKQSKQESYDIGGFEKYIPMGGGLGGEGLGFESYIDAEPPRASTPGYGRDSKIARSYRTVRRSDSEELYGAESLEGGVAQSGRTVSRVLKVRKERKEKERKVAQEKKNKQTFEDNIRNIKAQKEAQKEQGEKNMATFNENVRSIKREQYNKRFEGEEQ